MLLSGREKTEQGVQRELAHEPYGARQLPIVEQDSLIEALNAYERAGSILKECKGENPY